MSPTLALTLSFEGIGLLTRVDGGWHLLDEVGLDSEDLAAELGKLRDLAANQAGEGFSTLLVLPNDQIKFLSLKLGRKLGTKAQAQVAQVLEEETPYTADQLVFDTRLEGAQTQVAAVARETLAEAEAFAAEHAFNPVWFTAMPESTSFAGAPNFGATAGGAGAQIDFDGQAMQVVGSGPLPDPVPEPTPTPEPQPEPTPEPDVATATPDTDDAQPDNAPAPVETPAEPAPLSFASRREPAAPSTAPELGGMSRDTSKDNSTPEVTSPRIDAPLRFDPSRVVAGLAATDETPESPPAQGDDEGVSFFSRRRSAAPEGSEAKKSTKKKSKGKNKKTPPVVTASNETVAADAPIDTPAEANETLVAELPDTLPRDRDARRKQKDQEKDSLTVFGARASDVRGKPRYMGLILTTLLLVFLALVALWATYFVEDGVAGLLGSDEPEVVVVEPQAAQPVTPAPTVSPSETSPKAVVDLQQPTTTPTLENLGATEEVESAAVDPELLTPDVAEPELQPALTTDTITDSAEIEALLDGEDPRSLTEAEAEARYAVTGIWQKAPLSPLDVPSEVADDVYVPSIDFDLGALDAIALPAPELLLTDTAITGQLNPLAPGTTFEFDERGLVIASPEGTMSPEGIQIFAGRPAILPPAYPKRINVAQALAEQDSQLASIRPRARPSDLIETNERATLGGLTRSELAEIRPRPRPVNIKEADEVDTTPSAQAVATSLRPRVKPSNIAQLAQRATPSATPVVAVPAAATITPSIPTTASVARQATIQNAINLKKINLIGVYGTPSNRSALVRLSSGRYKKVKVGDRLDGGKVAAIADGELRYVKSGKNLTLKMPKG